MRGGSYAVVASQNIEPWLNRERVDDQALGYLAGCQVSRSVSSRHYRVRNMAGVRRTSVKVEHSNLAIDVVKSA